MLPPGIHPLAEIEQECTSENQLTWLVSLLMYLLTKINPNLVPQDGQTVKTRERVEANSHLFTSVPDILFAIRIRNTIVHPEDRTTTPTVAEINRAVKHLINAANELRDHYRIPTDVRSEVFRAAPRPPEASPRSASNSTKRTNKFDGSTHSTGPDTASTSPPSPGNATRPFAPSAPARSAWPKHPLRWAIIFATAALLLTFAKPIVQSGRDLFSGSERGARIRRQAAETAIKRMQSLGRQSGFANKITEAQSTWRDAEIAFNQERFKEAESGYQHVPQISDELSAHQYERDEAQKLIAELQNDRAAARASQAPQLTPQVWQDAEIARRAADAAFKNNNFVEAKQQALQAKQKYEEAKGATDRQPAPSPEATVVAVSTPPSTPNPPPYVTAAPNGDASALRRRDTNETIEAPAERPKLTRPRPAPENVPDAPEANDIFFIYQKEFMRYVKKRVAPVLPPEAKAQGIYGSVTIEVVLSKNGYLSKMQAVEGQQMLRQAAISALQQWQFKPYVQDRIPIDVRSEIIITVH